MRRATVLILLGAGCSPLSALPPFHFQETVETLGRGGVSVTASGGGAVAGLDGSGGGGALRARVGLGAQHEIGVEASALYISAAQDGDNPKPWEGASGAYAAKLAWKVAPSRYLALLLGAGGAYAATGGALGGDAALLVDTGRALKRVIRPYAGLRFSFALPINRPLHQDGGVTLGLLPTLGAAFIPHPRLRLLLEATYYNAWADSSPDKRPYHGGLGASAGISFLWDQPRPTYQ